MGLRYSIAVGCFIVAGIAPNASALTPSFMSLGDLNSGGTNSRAFGVSADGMLVVGWGTSASGTEAFLWSESDAMQGLGDLPGGGFFSEASAVSNDGVVVGDSSVAGGDNPFRWDSTSGMTSLGTLGGSEIQGFANDISADGTIIVGQSKDLSNNQIAFRWTQASGMTPLGTFAGSATSNANGISHDGDVIVGSGSSATEGWYWTSTGGFQGVGRLDAGGVSIARATSADGSVIVGEASVDYAPNRIAFRWSGPGTIQDIGELPGGATASEAWDVSGNGTIAVGSSAQSEGTLEAVMWTFENASAQIHHLQSYLQNDLGLDLSGWLLQRATSISEDGNVIVGYGISPTGSQLAWRAVIPEPGSIVALIPVSLGIIRQRTSRKSGR